MLGLSWAMFVQFFCQIQIESTRSMTGQFRSIALWNQKKLNFVLNL